VDALLRAVTFIRSLCISQIPDFPADAVSLAGEAPGEPSRSERLRAVLTLPRALSLDETRKLFGKLDAQPLCDDCAASLFFADLIFPASTDPTAACPMCSSSPGTGELYRLLFSAPAPVSREAEMMLKGRFAAPKKYSQRVIVNAVNIAASKLPAGQLPRARGASNTRIRPVIVVLAPNALPDLKAAVARLLNPPPPLTRPDVDCPDLFHRWLARGTVFVAADWLQGCCSGPSERPVFEFQPIPAKSILATYHCVACPFVKRHKGWFEFDHTAVPEGSVIDAQRAAATRQPSADRKRRRARSGSHTGADLLVHPDDSDAISESSEELQSSTSESSA
jgi:hypothetical protein